MIVGPRRFGKTHLILSTALHRLADTRRSRGFYTAHRRETAAQMWVQEWFPMLEDGPLTRHLQLRKANGSESITWRANHSSFQLLPPDGDAIRSAKSLYAAIDEMRQYSLAQGDVIEDAAFPTQASIPGGGQITFWSNAPSADASEWMKRWCETGRAAVDEGRTDLIAYFEWGLPDDADIDDEANWYLAHPGLGHHVAIEALRADRLSMSTSGFCSEYLGIWAETLRDTQLVDAWDRGTDPNASLGDPVAFAVETTIDRDRTVIVAAGAGPRGVAVELVDDRPHGPWVIPRLVQLSTEHNTIALGWDTGGPVRALATDIATEVPTRLVGLSTPDMAAAAGAFHDWVIAERVTHRDDPVMMTAVAAGIRRPAGGAWLFDRREPPAIPLIAATIARSLWADSQHRAPRVA